jgi:lysine 2,3-aminomutase
MFSIIPRRGVASGRGSRITPKLSSARAVGSISRLQAQVADISNRFDNGDGGIPPLLNKMPVRDAASTVHPVTTIIPQNRDEFWRKVPVWENVSAGDFLSYRWSVSLAYCRSPMTP